MGPTSNPIHTHPVLTFAFLWSSFYTHSRFMSLQAQCLQSNLHTIPELMACAFSMFLVLLCHCFFSYLLIDNWTLCISQLLQHWSSGENLGCFSGGICVLWAWQAMLVLRARGHSGLFLLHSQSTLLLPGIISPWNSKQHKNNQDIANHTDARAGQRPGMAGVEPVWFCCAQTASNVPGAPVPWSLLVLYTLIAVQQLLWSLG